MFGGRMGQEEDKRYENVPHNGQRYMENGVEVYWNLQEEDPSTDAHMEEKLKRVWEDWRPKERKRLEEERTRLLEVRTLENGQVIAKWKVK